MTTSNYTTKFQVDQSPKEVFDAINNVLGWWSGKIEGNTDELGAEFTYTVTSMHYSKQKITEFTPDKKIVWHVLESNINFVNNTEVQFTHIGLVPAYECYNGCSNAWSELINGNLRKLITTGKDQPSPW